MGPSHATTAGDDGAVPQAGARAAQPAMIPPNAAHIVPVLQNCVPPELLRAMDAMDEEPLDPMHPLDFGIDLNDITGVTEHGTLGLVDTALPPPPPPPSLPTDFGVVPSAPLRDGMVPAFPGDSPDLPGAAAELQPTLTARALGNALYWGFSYGMEAYRPVRPAVLEPRSDVGPGDALRAAADAPAEAIPARVPRLRATESTPKDIRSRAEIVSRWREKKARRLMPGGRPGGVQYESRKRTALVKPRINGKFVTPEVYQRHLGEQEKLLHTVPTAE